MPREMNGKRYWSAAEVCQEIAISRPTLYRWLKRGILTKLHRDRKGWRMFTEEDVRIIRLEANKVDVQELS
ncbi:MerR family transcriptional regulator [Chloroflexota bacterium]